jgi:hypothetical protein
LAQVIAQLDTITQLAGGAIQPELQDIQVSGDPSVRDGEHQSVVGFERREPTHGNRA